MLEHYSYLGSFAASIEGDGNSATRGYLDELFAAGMKSTLVGNVLKAPDPGTPDAGLRKRQCVVPACAKMDTHHSRVRRKGGRRVSIERNPAQTQQLGNHP